MNPTKGTRSRRVILEDALQLATVVGLDGLTIGTLAKRLNLSKSGLFAHFGSKEALQQAILETGVEHFMGLVVQPALTRESGAEMARELFAGWIEWSSERMAGGCLFVTAAVEFDDRAGPVRDQVVGLQRRWLDLIEGTARHGISSGEFRTDLDPAQFAHDFNSILLGFNQVRRLLRDPEAEGRARRALERLLEDAHRQIEP